VIAAPRSTQPMLWQRLALAERFARRVNRAPRRWLAVFAVLLAVQISPCWYVTRDGCLYLSLARSIAAGGPLQCLGFPVCVPPGYPLLVSPAFLLGDRPFLALSVLNWLFAVALLLGIYHWARRVVPQAAVWVAGLTAVNAGVCYYYRRTLKEIAFMAAAVWAVNALATLERASGRSAWLRRATLAGVLVVFAILIRYTSVVLVAGLGAAVLLERYAGRRRRSETPAVSEPIVRDSAVRPGAALRERLPVSRPMLVTAAALGAVALLVLGGLVWQVGSGYLLGFSTLDNPLAQLAEGLRIRIGNLARVMVPGMLKAYGGPRDWLDWNIVLGLGLAAVVIWGWRRLALERRDIWACSLPLYIALYIIWPYHQGARFMVPMVPLLIACFWLGIERLRRVRGILFAACFAAHLGGTYGYWALIDAPRAAQDHRYWKTARRLAETMHFRPREIVAASRVPNALEAMLVLSTDRFLIEAEGPLGTDVRWLVQPVESSVRDGYVVAREIGKYRLLERSAARPAPLPESETAPESERAPVLSRSGEKRSPRTPRSAMGRPPLSVQ
jgi:Dolichyl-phosphate-mannose-protein mannosyltransferase